MRGLSLVRKADRRVDFARDAQQLSVRARLVGQRGPRRWQTSIEGALHRQSIDGARITEDLGQDIEGPSRRGALLAGLVELSAKLPNVG